MSAGSAADWCRAVLEEVSPSPLNNVPPLPAHVPVPPPPPPVYTGGSKQATTPLSTYGTTATAAAVPQPSAQYQAYYDRYYQQATATAQQTAISR